MKQLFIIFFLSISFFGNAQVGEVFPAISTEMVSGKSVDLPSFFSGKFVLVGIGTSKKAEEALRTWQQPIYSKFIAKTGMMDDLYEVEVCFLPLFTGASKAAKSKVVKRLKENNESLVIQNVYIYAGERAPFKDIGVVERGEPYFILLNPSGEIVWSAKGKFRQAYFDDIESVLTE